MANNNINKPVPAPAQQAAGPAKPPTPPPPPPQKHQKPPKRKDIKVYEFKIYTLSNGYSGDYELLVTTTQQFKDIIEISGRTANAARLQAEEYVRSIGTYGITVEDPEGTFNFY